MKKKILLISLALLLIVMGLVLARNTESGSGFLNDELVTLTGHIKNRDAKNTTVSAVDVAWHLDHSLKSINGICEALAQSDPKAYRSNINFARLFVFTWGDFPRGVAKAPKQVLPPTVIHTNDLYQQLQEVRENLKKLEQLEAKAHYKHPYFNVIDKGQTKRFIKIHTRHHLKIVQDILGE
ncbi:DUF1569 domain-containing protein [uncultured Croceitalea sp.]|uniref:DUF1569 domain-containing protein n=1 Tax=uncultured Croceitalea sp. TaxID=1798908 RepID=UPI0033062E74